MVLEASDRVGGRVRTDDAGGYTIDAGAQFMSTGYRHIQDLCRELGLAERIVETSRYFATVRDGRLRRSGAGNPLSIARSGLVSWRAWMGLGSLVARVAVGTWRLSLSDYSQWAAFDDRSTAAWLSGSAGEEIYRYLMEPAIEGLYFQDPRGTSRALAMVLLALASRGHKTLTLRGGFASLAQALASRLKVRTGTRVVRVREDEARVVITTERGTIEADAAILAAPAPEARSIYEPRDQTEQRLLDVRYSATVNVAIGTAGPLCNAHLRGVYGVFVPGVERRVIAALGIESNKCADRVLQGELLNVMLSDAAGAALVRESDETIVAAVMPELGRYLPDLERDVRFLRVYRWPRAEPRSPVGRSCDIRDYRRALRDRRVVLAGDYLGMPFTEGAAETGRWAARWLCAAALR